MADEIIRTIYKLEIEDSGYIKGVESLSASTNKFAQIQDAANKALKILESTLAEQSKALQKAKQDLDSYTGADEKYRQQLTKTFNDQKVNNDKLVGLVSQARQEYEKATKAAQDFANTSAKANNLQQQPGARIVNQPPPGIAAGLNAQIFNTIDLNDMAALGEATAKTRVEFDELRDSVTLAEERLKQLDEGSEEFKALVPVIDQAKKALAEYDQAAEGATESTTSLRTQIRLGREELVKLEAQGKGNTKEYFELEKRVAKLTDAFGDQQARIKILASDTKLLDFGKGAITAATSAFSAFTSVSILAGGASEELQKKTLQLFAAMQLLQSLEQLSNLTRREGILATLAQSGAQAAYTAVVGASTGALKVFRLALAATGIGAAIAAIVFLVQRYKELQEAEEKAALAEKTLLEINKQAVEGYAKEVTSLKLLVAEHNNTTTSLKRKKEIQDELQEQYPSYFANLDKQADKEAFIAEQADKVTQALIIQAKVQAAQGLLSEKFAKLLKEQFDPTEAVDFFDALGSSIRNFGNIAGSAVDLSATAKKNISKAQEEYKTFEKFITDFVSNSNTELEKLGGDPKAKGGKTKDNKEIENVFAQRLRELQSKLAEVTAKSFESEGTIRKQFAISLEKEISTIGDLVKAGKLTGKQSAILIDLTARINEVQLNQALGDFNKKVLDARNKLNDELRSLQQKNTEDSINLLQDEFERRKQLIDFNEKQQLESVTNDRISRLEALEQEKNLIGLQAYEDAKEQIYQQAEDAQTNIVIKATQERQQLAADSFKKSLEFFQNAINEIDLIDDQDSAKEVRALSDKFLAQKITFENFQKELARIEREYAAKKRDRDLIFERSELEHIDNQIKNTVDKNSKQYADLLKLREDQAKKVAELEKTDAVKDATDKGQDENKKRVETVADYATAIGGLTDSIIQFWVKANEAEAAALDRSISLQEKRIDAAQRIAERGNAQYLKAEEDRLKELQVARENAARRQLGIDAALQASQVLVGITGAIAKIATPGIGIAETIGAIGVIVGALATGYGLVKSLQGNQPTFFVGTKDTGRGGKDDHRGGFTATLHPHEAVIPRDKNEKYKPTIDAIFDGKIHPDVINDFVLKHNSIKRVPQVNYDRIKDAAELKISHDGKMAVILNEHSGLLRENNELQKEILKKRIKVENKIDRDGVASMVTEYIEQQKIDRKI